jgi:ribonuclease III
LRLVPSIITNFFSLGGSDHLSNLLGFTPKNKALYDLAFRHRSADSTNSENNNERLEFLGDAVLGGIVADYLYKKYPKQSEGFLTEMRSKMVNRATLNSIAIKIGLKELVQFNPADTHLRKSQIFGNALEALIGAIYIDKGYLATKKFILSRIIKLYMNIDDLEKEESNQKNKIISWANKNKKQIDFVLLQEKNL